MSDVKAELHRKLRAGRAGVLSRVDGLGEYDLRRPLTPTGTNLLGLVKHLARVEYVYLGTSFGRPPPETLAWEEDGSVWEGADMWAKPDESSDYLIGLYRRACEHGDRTIEQLDLDAPAGSRTGLPNVPTPPSACCSSAWSPRPPSTPGTPTSSASSSTAPPAPTTSPSATPPRGARTSRTSGPPPMCSRRASEPRTALIAGLITAG